MIDLLDTALIAHGGLERWNTIRSIVVNGSITGAFWSIKNQGDALADIRFEVDTARKRLTMEFVDQDKQTVFERQSVIVGYAASDYIQPTYRESSEFILAY